MSLDSALSEAMSGFADMLIGYLPMLLALGIIPWAMMMVFRMFRRMVSYEPSVGPSSTEIIEGAFADAGLTRRQLRSPEPLHIEDKKLCSCELCKPTDPQLVARMLSTTPPSIDEWNGWADYSKRSVKR